MGETSKMKSISEQQDTMITQERPLISIIVPVYQVKDYLGACVESLRAQTYANLEIILVDDGSTDGSGEMCGQYAAMDGRIRVAHQENRGLSAARNTGLACMKGELAAFVDSDDIVQPDFIETLYGLMEKYRADIAACAYIKCSVENQPDIKKAFLAAGAGSGESGEPDGGGTRGRQGKRRAKGKELCMTSEQMLRQWHGKYKKWETVVWNKLYRKSVLAGQGDKPPIRFPVGRRHEDVLTSHLLVANAARIALTKEALYLYRVRPGSITDQRMAVGYKEENLRAQRERMAFFKKKRYWRAYLNLWVGYALHWGWFGWRNICTIRRNIVE